MSSSSHVQSQDNLLLHTSTRTSDYYSAQSSRSTDQTSVESSESNAEAVSSDLKERNVPNTGMCISSTVEPLTVDTPQMRTHTVMWGLCVVPNQCFVLVTTPEIRTPS